LPKNLQIAAKWLPFTGLVDAPLQLYSGHLAPSEAALSLARTLAWASVFIALGRLLLRQSLNRVEVQGG
jgi:ABC-type uncharacterized transport system permease subunit